MSELFGPKQDPQRSCQGQSQSLGVKPCQSLINDDQIRIQLLGKGKDKAMIGVVLTTTNRGLSGIGHILGEFARVLTYWR
jgi:hypothetical protein